MIAYLSPIPRMSNDSSSGTNLVVGIIAVAAIVIVAAFAMQLLARETEEDDTLIEIETNETESMPSVQY